MRFYIFSCHRLCKCAFYFPSAALHNNILVDFWYKMVSSELWSCIIYIFPPPRCHCWKTFFVLYTCLYYRNINLNDFYCVACSATVSSLWLASAKPLCAFDAAATPFAIKLRVCGPYIFSVDFLASFRHSVLLFQFDVIFDLEIVMKWRWIVQAFRLPQPALCCCVSSSAKAATQLGKFYPINLMKIFIKHSPLLINPR